jgi:hypothetical protein
MPDLFKQSTSEAQLKSNPDDVNTRFYRPDCFFVYAQQFVLFNDYGCFEFMNTSLHIEYLHVNDVDPRKQFAI